MKFHVVSIFPEMIEGAIRFGVTAQGIKKKLVEVTVLDPRQFTKDVHQSVDDKPFGGGDGMLMLAEPLAQSVEKIKESRGFGRQLKVIYLSPQGALFDQKKAQEMHDSANEFILICGRYAGVDQRFIDQYVDEELSVGNYILSGGELAALIVMEACFRFVPGVLGHQSSRTEDSLSDGLNGLLEAPQWTRPQVWRDQSVPELLVEGHHLKIHNWKRRMSLVMTALKRPDLLPEYFVNEVALGSLEDLWVNWSDLDGLDLPKEQIELVRSRLSIFRKRS